MGSESPKETIEPDHEEARNLPTVSLVSHSSSARASSKHDISTNTPRNESISKSKSDGNLSRGQGSISISTPASASQIPKWSMISASPPIGLQGDLCQTTSPPIQTMTGFDPNRIPTSIFTTKPANASEWSVASNDSLFSIHMGNNSFTKEQFRLEELKTINEGNSSDDSLCVIEAKSSELSSLPPVMELPANEEESGKSGQVSNLEKEDSIHSSEDPKVAKGESPHCVSNGSDRSSISFAFPVLASDSEKGGSLEVVEGKQDSKDAENQTNGGWFPCLPRCC